MQNLKTSLLALALLGAPACNRTEPATGGIPSGQDGGTTTSQSPTPTCGSTSGPAVQDCNSMDAGTPADMAQTPPPGQTCGAQTFPLAVTHNAPNIHLVIDRSGSMSLNASTGLPPTNGQTAKWDDLTSTLTGILASYGTQANEWGMSIFPTTNDYESCVGGDVAVPLASPGTSIPAIAGILGQYNDSNLLTYDGKTPTDAVIQGVIDNVALDATDRNNYVVLMTDGMPTCGTDPGATVAPLITQLYQQNPPVRTFVIGFGTDTQSNPTLLNAWATAGHTALPGATQYFQASDAADLEAAFQSIVTGVASCTFTLTSPPTDPSLVVGELDGQPLAADLSNGFTYDVGSQTVTFHGSACQEIQNDPSTQVSVIYGCPASQAPIE